MHQPNQPTNAAVAVCLVLTIAIALVHPTKGQGQCTLARDASTCNGLPNDCHWCKANSFCAPLSMSCPSTSSSSASPMFYGLSLFSNSPATFQLNVLDSSTGNGTAVGPSHSEEFGMGDLTTIANDIYFYLGDTSAGTTLVGLNISNGAQVCAKTIALSEIGYVGIGQSLDYDDTSDTLVLSGLNSNKSSHVIYRSKATECGPFTKVEAFADSDYLPMLHASALDTAHQRLFVVLAPAKQTIAVGVIDLTGKEPMIVIGEDGGPDTLVSLHFDSHTSELVGIVPAATGGLELHRLHPTLKKWVSAIPVTGLPKDWNQLLGNSATVSSFDAVGRNVYFITGVENGAGNIAESYLAAVDVDTGKLGKHPLLSPIGLGGSGYESLNIYAGK